MTSKINICITCVGGRLIYDVIRGIRDTDDYLPFIIGVDSNKEAHGRLLCDNFFLVPHSENNPKAWLDEILKINNQFNIDILLVFSEGETIIISENIDILRKNNIKVAVNEKKTVSNLIDKLILMQTLKNSGLDVGSFYEINSKKDFLEYPLKLGYPSKKVVLKPRIGRGSRGVLIADEKQDRFLPLIPERFCGKGKLEVLLEEYSKNNKEFNKLICMPYYGGNVWDVDVIADKGSIINIAARVRQLKNPIWPTSTGHKSSNNKIILEYVHKINEILKLSGPNDFDIVLDDNGLPKILDAASRFSGSVGVSYIAGVNMLSQLIRYILKLPYKEFNFKENLILRPYLTMTSIPDNNELDFM